MRIDLGAVLLVLVVGGCAYVEDKNGALHQHEAEPGGPVLPPIAPGQLRPVGANFALFPAGGDEAAAVDSQVVFITNGSTIAASRFAAPDHVELTIAPDADDMGGERSIKVEPPPGAEVEVASDKCYDYRPANADHGCIVVLRAGKTLPPGPYKLTVAYAADAERSLRFTITK